MVFTTSLLRGYSLELPEQDLTFDWSQLTPEPKGGLRVRLRAKQVSSTEHGGWSTEMFRALAAVAWADGVLKPAEASALVLTARQVGLAPAAVAEVEAMTRTKTTLDGLALSGIGKERAEYVYALACLIGATDLEVAPAERASISQLGDLLGLGADDRRRAEAAGAGIAASLGLSSDGLEALSRATRP
jgi:tellurite resistance protein